MDRKRPRLDNNDDDDDDGITLPSDFDEDRYDDDDEPGYSYYPDPDNPALEGVAGDNWNRNGEGENEDESESDDEDGVNDVGRNVEVDLKEQDVVFSRGILDEKVILEKANKDASELLKEVNIEDQRMVLKEHPERYPLYVTGTGRFYLESFAPDYAKAYDFVVTIADPVTRQKFIQEFQLNTYSLFSAVVIGKDYEYVRSNLERFLKTKEVPKYVGDFIKVTMEKNGRPRLVLRGNKYMVESYNDGIIKKLANDDVFKKSWLISKRILAREKVVKKPPAPAASAAGKTPAEAAQALQQQREQQQREQQERQMDLEKKMKKKVVIQRYYDDDDDDDEALATSTVVPSAPGHPAVPVKRKSVHGFEIDNADVEEIKRRGYELGCPLIEEYSYKEEPKFAPRPPPGKDSGDASSMLAPAPVPTCSPLKINLRSFVAIRPYQEKSLSRMFASSRARSGIIVLACGAGKTLVGITAACTIQKSCLVVCNSTVSVHQWKAEFMRWSDIDEDSIALFTSEEKKSFDTDKIRPLVIANYNILTMADENVNKASKKIRLGKVSLSFFFFFHLCYVLLCYVYFFVCLEISH